MDKKSLYIYNASAGAGKTFSLVVEYISILVENPANYAHILAVTFTNKATAEMKNRIMSVLYGLSKGQELDYCNQIVKKTNIPPAVVQERAGEALQKILHNYSNFSIETIDSFFQRVLRNMTRELGIGASFNLLLEDSEIVTEAINETINLMESNADLKKWYREYIGEQIEDGRSWKVEQALQDFAKNLNSESFKTKEIDFENNLNRTFLDEVKKSGKAFCTEIQTKLAAFTNNFDQLLEDEGCEITDFSNGRRGALGLFFKINELKEDLSEARTIQKAYENPYEYAWQPKNMEGKTLASPEFIENKLIPLFNETYEYYIKHFRAYKTAQLAIKNIHLLGLINDIATLKKQILVQQNSFLLSETANLLARIIQSDEGLDISFVYEKMGTHYQYIMIDEFQDTSHLNWENFKLLLSESLDNGNKSIIVGDAKQSIYRWNNGDWHIFTDIQQEFTTRYRSYKTQTELITLANNFRTGKTIVDFNNELFTEGLKNFNGFSEEQFGEINKIYTEDTKQIAQKKGGSIVCQFYEKQKDTSRKEIAFEFMRNEINRLFDCEFSSGDITILCRKKNEIKEIIAYFSENPLYSPSGERVLFVSNEAFMYRSALSIRLIINALTYISNPYNTTALAFVKLLRTNDFAQAFDVEKIDNVLADRANLLNKSTFDLVLYLMREFNIFSYESEFAFIFSFLDSVYEFSTHYTSNLVAFLHHWDDKLNEQTITTSQQGNAIQLLTIHKSKGLEFPAVIIPFCDWEFINNRSAFLKNYMWIDCTQVEKNETEESIPIDFEKVGVLPVFKSNLQNTYFERQKQQEEVLETIDTLNELYVALTRPERSLALCGVRTAKDKNVADILCQFLIKKEETIEEDGVIQYNIGTDEKFEQGTKKTSIFAPEEEVVQAEFSTRSAEITYSQTKKAEEFVENFDTFNVEDKSLTPRMLGIVLHGILAQIEKSSDCEKAIQNALLRGEIREEHITEIRSILQIMFSHSKAQEWFCGKHRTLNEVEIICGENSENLIVAYRPDRIMITPENEVIIVDYKFSESKKQLSRYKKQVQHYAQLLKEIGYPNVSSYLWFALQENEIIEVA